MLLSRLIKPHSSLYKNISVKSKEYDFFMKWDPLRWFGMWCMTLGGFNIVKGNEDRYVFWDWSSGTFFIYLVLLIITIWTVLTSNNSKIPKTINDFRSILYFLILGILSLLMGALSQSLSIKIVNYFPYIFYYFGVLLVFSINLKQKDETSSTMVNGKRLSYLIVSSILIFLSSSLGYYLDDPIISTVSTVYLPFLIVSIIMPIHVRHLQRARMYGLFIPAVFLSIRYPWFLIPLLSLFFILRTYHYFRFNIVFPTFAVDIE